MPSQFGAQLDITVNHTDPNSLRGRLRRAWAAMRSYRPIDDLCLSMRGVGVEASVVEESLSSGGSRGFSGILRFRAPTLAERLSHRQDGSSGVLKVTDSPISFLYVHRYESAEFADKVLHVAVPDARLKDLGKVSFRTVVTRSRAAPDGVRTVKLLWEGTDSGSGALEALNSEREISRNVSAQFKHRQVHVTYDRSLNGHWVISLTLIGSLTESQWLVLEALGRELQNLPVDLQLPTS